MIDEEYDSDEERLKLYRSVRKKMDEDERLRNSQEPPQCDDRTAENLANFKPSFPFVFPLPNKSPLVKVGDSFEENESPDVGSSIETCSSSIESVPSSEENRSPVESTSPSIESVSSSIETVSPSVESLEINYSDLLTNLTQRINYTHDDDADIRGSVYPSMSGPKSDNEIKTVRQSDGENSALSDPESPMDEFDPENIERKRKEGTDRMLESPRNSSTHDQEPSEKEETRGAVAVEETFSCNDDVSNDDVTSDDVDWSSCAPVPQRDLSSLSSRLSLFSGGAAVGVHRWVLGA